MHCSDVLEESDSFQTLNTREHENCVQVEYLASLIGNYHLLASIVVRQRTAVDKTSEGGVKTNQLKQVVGQGWGSLISHCSRIQ